MILTDEDIEYINFAKSIIDKAHFPSSEKITEVYNRVYADKPNFRAVTSTNCGSCLRQRVLTMHRDLENVLKKMEKKMEQKKNETNNSEQIKTNECKQK